MSKRSKRTPPQRADKHTNVEVVYLVARRRPETQQATPPPPKGSSKAPTPSAEK